MASNVSQSVRDRLLNRTRETGEDHQVVLTRFALERLLYRISQLPEGDNFALKGAFAFLVWEGKLSRQTRDLDLLGSGPPDTKRLEEILVHACEADVEDDGIQFRPNSLEVAPIREGAEYEGIRAELKAYIGSARLRLQIDVGFGDTVVPHAQRKTFPGLLDFPEPEIKTYPPETVVSEKVHGMVRFGRANTRMKDFYDVWRISKTLQLGGDNLVEAFQSTFECRETALPLKPPVAITETFVEQSGKKRQWQAFAQQIGRSDLRLRALVDRLRKFLLPVLRAATKKEQSLGRWYPDKGWTTG